MLDQCSSIPAHISNSEYITHHTKSQNIRNWVLYFMSLLIYLSYEKIGYGV